MHLLISPFGTPFQKTRGCRLAFVFVVIENVVETRTVLCGFSKRVCVVVVEVVHGCCGGGVGE